ncbi:MAG: hypothetical protein HZA03_07015 [Nitrospinae bacterium]|nr:hypothetical protein [Nitrospinota bacterium]
MAATVPKVLESMNVSVTQSGANNAVISGADAATVRANDVLILDNPYGQSLKKVIVAKTGAGSGALPTNTTVRESALM